MGEGDVEASQCRGRQAELRAGQEVVVPGDDWSTGLGDGHQVDDFSAWLRVRRRHGPLPARQDGGMGKEIPKSFLPIAAKTRAGSGG